MLYCVSQTCAVLTSAALVGKFLYRFEFLCVFAFLLCWRVFVYGIVLCVFLYIFLDRREFGCQY